MTDSIGSRILDAACAIELATAGASSAYDLALSSAAMHEVVVATRWAGAKHSGPLKLYGFEVVVDNRTAGPDGFAFVHKPT